MMRLQPHTLKRGVQLVAVTDDSGALLCAIYETPRGLKIVSKYIENRPDLVVIDPDEPPALLVNLR